MNFSEKIFAGSEEVSYVYSASGQKLATKAGSSTTYYRGSFIYNNDELDHILHAEGIIRKTTGAYVYYYAKKDHLGSTRVLCHEGNGKMLADQTTNYYPFGLSFQSNGTNVNRYLFSGKELQDQTVNGKTLQLYDFGARNYDPMLGRWFNIDPLAAKYYSISPYVYCLNSPVKFIDPDGREVRGITRGDAKKFLADIHNVLKDEKFANIRALISLEGKMFKNIDIGALSSATKKLTLTDDESAYINMVTSAINSKDLHNIEYVSGDFTSKEGANAYANYMNNRFGNGLGTNMLTSDGLINTTLIYNTGDGLNVPTDKGSHSYIRSKLGQDERAVTTGHEVFGHGIPSARKLTDAENNSNAIRTDNLIRRLLKMSPRDGQDHGGYKEGQINDPYILPILK